ncbi:M1 family peptidase [Permianibacter sp. IMCC34836]|uniref:M1 family metallopeptidase n=1 Tax=Permianibacter fluminis TaxID=2738515 RepID=UPI0015581EF5|nr:M1 family metallopeptidase [Permianibacter fluminis]NQD35703.1 M1 family peptidase [Permianibacter fluminis]
MIDRTIMEESKPMWKKILLVLIVLAVAAGGRYWWLQRPADLRDSPQGQLPDTVTPLAYQLDLKIDPMQDGFSGTTSIRVKLNSESNRIWLHGQRLQVANATVTTAAGERFPVDYEEMADSGVAELRFNRTLAAQELVLAFEYRAPFDRTLNGLYLVEDGDERYAFTQMESHFARRAFPSFDEPRFKVPFTVSLTVPASLQAIANTPESQTEALGDGWKKILFATSKPLPTYLLAWAVGKLDVVEWQPIPSSAIRDHAIPLRGIATHGKGGQLKYALEQTAGLVQQLEAYFGIAYPYEKLDILAVPDFEAGAMENAGAIAYREQLLLMDEHAAIQQRRDFIATHAHELAHQWFGNLVTMPWWNDIWLNESFATWMENKIVKQFAPEMGFELDDLISANEAMHLDALASMREIRQPILNNADIAATFDGITYSKGAAVIAMFENFVGEAVFRRAVNQYLNRYAYGSATAEQFVAAIADAAGDERINAAFFSFLTQVGVPEISLSGHCEKGLVNATLSQSRFLPLGSQASRNSRWQVPVCVSAYGSFGSRKLCTLLTETEQSWQFELPACPSHIMPNANGRNYYRIKLAPADRQALLSKLNELPVTEAYTLADSFASGLSSGQLDINEYLVTVPTLAKHPNREVAMMPVSTLAFVHDYLVTGADRQTLERFYSRVYQPKLDAIGLTPVPGESADIRLQRNALIDFLSNVAHSERVRTPLRDWGKAYIGFDTDHALHPDALPTDLIPQALIVASQDFDAPFFEALMAQLDHTDDGVVRDYLIAALANADDPTLAANARDLVTGIGLRTNERMTIVYNQMSNAEQVDGLFQWFKSKYRVLRPLMPDGVQQQMPMLADRYCTPEQAQDVHDYFQPLMEDLPGGDRALDNTLEKIALCHAFVQAQPAIQWEPLSQALN